MTSSAPWRTLRILIAIPAMILGSLATLLGASGFVTALLTGHRDPYHGGAMLLVSGAGTLVVGAVLLLIGIVLWRRTPRALVLVSQPPNKRLKLSGAGRSNGIGVFGPWRAQDFVHYS